MTKRELMETYTAEQLAGMVVNLQSASEVKNDEIYKLKWQISSLEECNGRLQAKLDTYNNYLLPRCTKEAKEMIDHNNFSEVRIVTWKQWNNRNEKTMNISDIQKCQEEYEKVSLEGVINKISRDIIKQKNNAMAMEFTRIICDLLKQNGAYVHCTETKLSEKITHNSIEEQYGIVFDSMDFSQHDKEFTDEIEELKSQLDRRQTIIAQIDEILEELFGVKHDAVRFGEFEQFLREKVIEKVSNFLPTEPIKVADMLINAEGEYEHNPLTNAFCGKDKGTYRIFDISELRQIAEHILVYCNHNGEVEE